MRFYVTTNNNGREPDTLFGIDYIHIKAKSSGENTAIVSEVNIYDNDIEEMTQEELQSVLDSWIAEENENPYKDIDNNDIVQNNINLNKFFI